MPSKIVIDTSSLINFFRYYYFDKNSTKKIFNTLNDFILKKIKAKEIIIIDKVFNELKSNNETRHLKQHVESETVKTFLYFNDVEELIDKYYIKSHEKFLNDNDVLIGKEIEKFQEGFYADLYLIAHCMDMISKGELPILITEENIKTRDDKLIEKIPSICMKENIKCHNLPYSLFEFYKKELIFDLKILK